jgi:hypothetical protein
VTRLADGHNGTVMSSPADRQNATTSGRIAPHQQILNLSTNELLIGTP